ncbi:hypothetical protein CB1_000775006 [Camelus ferus]|nr:hypothetical protein CB1_000775006 [Camelus ferus]
MQRSKTCAEASVAGSTASLLHFCALRPSRAFQSSHVRFQPNEDKYSFKSCSSDFVFGENMVERVLGSQKLTQPQLENDSYIKEKLFKFTLKFPINSPNSRTDANENITLIESAAAFSSKPSAKSLLEKIDVITGEEAEHNVLKASVKDTGCLYTAIHHRLVALRSFDKQQDVNQAESQPETVLQQFNCDSCDEDEDEDDFIQVTKTRSGKELFFCQFRGLRKKSYSQPYL